MGVLDDFMCDSGGVADALCETLGGTATLKKRTGQTRDETTGKITGVFTSTVVSFVPSANEAASEPAGNPAVGSCGVKARTATIRGAFPACQVSAAPVSGADVLEYRSAAYLITSVDEARVGNKTAYYKIEGTLQP